MTTSKSPEEALFEIGIMKNVVLILVLLGFALLSWGTIGSGFGFDAVLWFSTLLVGAGFWYLGERFTTNPNRSLLGLLTIGAVVFVVFWIAALIATVTIWEELSAPGIMGSILSVIVTVLMFRIGVLGRVLVGQQVQAPTAGPPVYSPPVTPPEPPVYSPPVTPSEPPAYVAPVQQAPVQPPPVQSPISCPTCGKQWPGGTKFCADDGTRLPQGCPSCGKPVAAGMKFCPYCGTPQSTA